MAKYLLIVLLVSLLAASSWAQTTLYDSDAYGGFQQEDFAYSPSYMYLFEPGGILIRRAINSIEVASIFLPAYGEYAWQDVTVEVDLVLEHRGDLPDFEGPYVGTFLVGAVVGGFQVVCLLDFDTGLGQLGSFDTYDTFELDLPLAFRARLGLHALANGDSGSLLEVSTPTGDFSYFSTRVGAENGLGVVYAPFGPEVTVSPQLRIARLRVTGGEGVVEDESTSWSSVRARFHGVP
jgi:hypothetical protein